MKVFNFFRGSVRVPKRTIPGCLGISSPGRVTCPWLELSSARCHCAGTAYSVSNKALLPVGPANSGVLSVVVGGAVARQCQLVCQVLSPRHTVVSQRRVP